MAESNVEERQKIEDRLAALTSSFKQLRDISQGRMTHLDDALREATEYEKQCDKFEAWLTIAEQGMQDMSPYAIASQPLNTKLEKVEVRPYT